MMKIARIAWVVALGGSMCAAAAEPAKAPVPAESTKAATATTTATTQAGYTIVVDTSGSMGQADLDAAEIVLVLHWAGGAHTEHRLPRRRRGQRNATPADVVEAVRGLALIMKDDAIAGVLTRSGLRTGNGNRWTRERVTSLRSHHRIPVYAAAADGIEPWLNLSRAAAVVGVAARTLRLAAERGEIDALHLLEGGPWLFRRADLGGPAARGLTLRARSNPRCPTVSDPVQENLFPSAA